MFVRYLPDHPMHRTLPRGTRITTVPIKYGGYRMRKYEATVARQMQDYTTTLFVCYDDDVDTEYQIRRDQIEWVERLAVM